MIDQIGAIAGTAVYAIMIAVLVSAAQTSVLQKRITLLTAVLWGVTIVTIAAFGGFAAGPIGPVAPPVFAFAAMMALLFGGWFIVPAFRRALLSVHLPALVALNIARVGGVLFLLLAADGRLSTPFATSAGWGDIITGLFAIPLAAAAWRDPDHAAAPLVVWNAFGTLDLVVAIGLGLLSAPETPFRVFTEGPGAAAMTGLPWVMVPAILVPIYLLIHLTIAVKLRSPHRVAAPAAMAQP